MSKFDKSVCDWVSSSSLDRGRKREILESIISTMDEYKKIDKKESSRQEENARPPRVVNRGESCNSNSARKKKNGANVDYMFSMEVNKVINRLDERGIPPPLPLPLHQGENESINVPLTSATRAYHPQNGISLIEYVEEAQEEQDDGNDDVHSDDVLTNGSCANVIQGERDDDDDLEAMQDQFRTFKFGKQASDPSEASSLEEERMGNAAADDHDENGDVDEMIKGGSDERRRRFTMKRPGVSALSIGPDEMMSTEFLTTPKSSEDTAFIVQVLEKHFLFSFLDDVQLHKLAMVMNIESIAEGTRVIEEGKVSSTFYIILEGEAVLKMYEEDENKFTSEHLQRGSVFGDIGLLYDTKSEVMVVSTTPLVCAVLEQNVYKILVSRAAEEKRKRYVSFLENVSFLKALTPEERLRLAGALKEGHYKRGDKIIKFGEKGDWLHIIVEGTVDVIGRNEDGEEEYAATGYVDDCFGDLEFLYHHETVADVIATSLVVKTAKLSRLQFENLIGNAKEFLDRKVKEDSSYQYYRRTMVGASPPLEDLTPPFDAPPGYLSKLNVPLNL